MNLVIAKNIFISTNGDLIGKKDAKVVTFVFLQDIIIPPIIFYYPTIGGDFKCPFLVVQFGLAKFYYSYYLKLLVYILNLLDTFFHILVVFV